MSPFCGATDTPVLDFWWYLPWVSKPGWIPRLPALSPACNEFLRFTSGVTPADLLAASMAASHIAYMHVAVVGCQDLNRRPPIQWADTLSTQPPWPAIHILTLFPPSYDFWGGPRTPMTNIFVQTKNYLESQRQIYLYYHICTRMYLYHWLCG